MHCNKLCKIEHVLLSNSPTYLLKNLNVRCIGPIPCLSENLLAFYGVQWSLLHSIEYHFVNLLGLPSKLVFVSDRYHQLLPLYSAELSYFYSCVPKYKTQVTVQLSPYLFTLDDICLIDCGPGPVVWLWAGYLWWYLVTWWPGLISIGPGIRYLLWSYNSGAWTGRIRVSWGLRVL